MASIKRTISAKTDKTGKAEVLLRISIDRNHKQRIKSGIFIPTNRFRDGEIIKPRANRKEAEELTSIENSLIELERLILSLCQQNDSADLTKEFFIEAIDKHRNPSKVDEESKADIFVILNEYLESTGLSQSSVNRYKVLRRALKRFEMYKQRQPKEKDFRLTFEALTDYMVGEFVDFFRDEPNLFELYPDIYEKVPAVTRTMRKPRRPEQRGENTIIGKLKMLRAFFNWAIKQGYTTNYPFAKYTIHSETYGTPYYLTIEERNTLAMFDLSKRPRLAVQRDIFIFQCLIGCRVSDLYGMTISSVIDGAVEYIPQKTKTERPEVVRVPLNRQAAELIQKYRTEGEKPNAPLFPFISSQKYNEAIKEMLRLAGIDRMVTILDSVTGEEVKKPIYEVASSHMARRTFIGNLYKKVKDPNLVGSLSGHKEGSKAFARYREIDEDIKKELVNML